MTGEQTRAFFERHITAWNGHDATALAGHYTDDAVIETPLLGTIHGRTAIEASYRSVFDTWPDSTQTDEALLVDGDRACRIGTATGTQSQEFMGLSGIGKPHKIQMVVIYQLAGDRIAHEQRFYDFTTLLAQSGVLKIKPAKA